MVVLLELSVDPNVPARMTNGSAGSRHRPQKIFES
jgi:hypothetical protein